MTIGANGTLVGMFNAVQNEEYQTNLDTKIRNILGDNESISLTALKNNSVFAEAYNKLDSTGQGRIEQIANMEGDAKNVSERELKVILTALDANLQDFEGKSKFFMDGEASTGETGGLNQATYEVLQDILQNTKTRAERQMKVQKKQEARSNRVNKTIKQAKNIKAYDDNGRVNGSEWTKAIQIIHENISWGSKAGQKAWNKAFERILGKGRVMRCDIYRDGGSREWMLKDGTKVFLSNRGFGKEVGSITVTHPDGVQEKFQPDGIKVE